jgi:hypothetical protein
MALELLLFLSLVENFLSGMESGVRSGNAAIYPAVQQYLSNLFIGYAIVRCRSNVKT